MQTLNAEQQAAVDSDAPRRLVAAGAGSGKTRTLIHAVEREAKKHGASGIVVLSFTNAACHELQERLATLGVTGLGFCGTTHAFLFRCLREWETSSITVIDDGQREAIVESIMEDMGVKTPLKHIMPLLDEPVRNATPSKCDLVATEYRHRLQAAGMVDFAAILTRGFAAVLGLKAKSLWNYSSIYIDEIQDASQPDWNFYNNAPFDRRYATGDDSQAIFGFRKGRVDIFVKLADQSGNPKVPEPKWELHVLDANYRSGAVICGTANQLIEHNKNRISKHTVAVSGCGAVVARRCENPAAELGYVLNEIHGLVRKVCHCGDWCDTHGAGSGHSPVPMEMEGECEYKDIAILCRTNYLARTFADYLKANGIPVATVEQPQRPPDWRETKLLITVLSNPFNDLAVLRLIEATECRHDAQRLREAAALRMVSVNEILGHRYGNACGSDLGIDGLKRLDQFGVSSESRELVHDACRELGKRGQWGLGDLIVYLGEQDSCARTVGEGITTCTVHASKGREWEVVYIVGCEENLFPSAKDAADLASLEEARRLLYVAATRAKRSLTLTWCCERPEYRGEQVPCGPIQKRERSRFISEMGLP